MHELKRVQRQGVRSGITLGFPGEPALGIRAVSQALLDPVPDQLRDKGRRSWCLGLTASPGSPLIWRPWHTIVLRA